MMTYFIKASRDIKYRPLIIALPPLSYTIYLETALPNIFGQKSVIENMADCDVKRVTGPYFFRMIADQ